MVTKKKSVPVIFEPPYIIPNMRIAGGKICVLRTLLLNTKRQHLPMNKLLKLLKYHRIKTGKYFNSMSNSKFWIIMKNDYPDLHEIAIRFLLCFFHHISL